MRFGTCLLIAIGTTPLLWAHAVDGQCKLKADRVEVEVYFSDNTPAADAALKVIDAEKNTVAEGLADGDGKWSFPRPKSGEYQLVIDAGVGHRKEKRFTIRTEGTLDMPENSRASSPNRVSAGPAREEFTAFPWLKAGIGCGLLGAVGFGFWLARQRKPTDPGGMS